MSSGLAFPRNLRSIKLALWLIQSCQRFKLVLCVKTPFLSAPSYRLGGSVDPILVEHCPAQVQLLKTWVSSVVRFSQLFLDPALVEGFVTLDHGSGPKRPFVVGIKEKLGHAASSLRRERDCLSGTDARGYRRWVPVSGSGKKDTGIAGWCKAALNQRFRLTIRGSRPMYSSSRADFR